MKSILTLNLLGIAAGLVVFAVGAVMLSGAALVGIVIAAGCSVWITWEVLGQKAVTRGIAGGLVGAALAWVAMRVMMRWVALSSARPVTLTIEGTSAILLTSMMLSILPAMGYLHFRNRLGSRYRFALSYGVILLALGGIPMVIILLEEIFSIARIPLIPATFLLAVPVTFALSMEAALRAMEGRGKMSMALP